METTLISKFKKLSFDNNNMNTKLAEEYLRTKTDGFHSIMKDSLDYYDESVVNVGLNAEVYEIKGVAVYNEYRIPVDEIILKEISKQIEINTDLISQMEMLIRGIPQNDTKYIDITKLKNHLANKESHSFVDYSYILMTEDTPLFTLVNVINNWKRGLSCTIYATPFATPICSLFVELCFKAGLPGDSIELITCSEDGFHCFNYDDYRYTTGVVTEFADMDSAVDVLLSATSHYRYPWRLRRILVQENVYERFKASVKRKAKPPSEKNTKLDITYSEHTVQNDYNYRTHFVFDNSADFIDMKKDVVYVESYRTTKEMLSLVNKYKPTFLSLWCTDFSTSNDIVYSVDACNVTVNSCFSHHCQFFNLNNFIKGTVEKINSLDKNDRMVKLLADFRELNIAGRLSVISDVLKENPTFNENDVQEIMSFLKNINVRNQIDVNNDTMAISLSKSNEIYYIGQSHPGIKILNKIKLLLMIVLKGNGIIFLKHTDHEKLEVFCGTSLPILHLVPRNFDSRKQFVMDYSHSTKHIWSRHGETFAN